MVKTRTRHGHFIQDDIAAFDAPFFAMTPAQAAALDPQQRGLLESTYRALENGMTRDPPPLPLRRILTDFKRASP